MQKPDPPFHVLADRSQHAMPTFKCLEGLEGNVAGRSFAQDTSPI